MPDYIPGRKSTLFHHFGHAILTIRLKREYNPQADLTSARSTLLQALETMCSTSYPDDGVVTPAQIEELRAIV